jgi:arsenite-transporting ATPase
LKVKKEIYKKAIETLYNKYITTLILVSRLEKKPLKEAKRTSQELKNIGINNQVLIINGMRQSYDDSVSRTLFDKQREDLKGMPVDLKNFMTYKSPLRAYNITGLDNVRAVLHQDNDKIRGEKIRSKRIPKLKNVIDDLYVSGKKVVFTVGKGEVWKTTIAVAIALGLARKGTKVHLTTTDPTAHVKFVIEESNDITISRIYE